MASNFPYEQIKTSQNSYGSFNDQTTTATTTFNPSASGSRETTILVLGVCPACKIGMLETDFTALGICCGLLLFPIGILCCFLTRRRRCNYCGSIFN